MGKGWNGESGAWYRGGGLALTGLLLVGSFYKSGLDLPFHLSQKTVESRQATGGGK